MRFPPPNQDKIDRAAQFVIDGGKSCVYAKGQVARLGDEEALGKRRARGVRLDQRSIHRIKRNHRESPSPLEICDIEVEVGVTTFPKKGNRPSLLLPRPVAGPPEG